MQKAHSISRQTRNNWLIDAVLALSALVVGLTGVYFLSLPIGGFQGGRNPYYGFTLFFERYTWDLLHTWSGVLMIAAAVIHFSIHWGWVVGMARRVWQELTRRNSVLNARGRFNLWLDVGVGVSFITSAVSGVYFLLVPDSLTLIILATLHFAIHWQWVVKVTRRIFAPRAAHAIASVQPRQSVVSVSES
mgnify:CR=1 FL=1